MADAKLSALVAETAPVDADLLYIVGASPGQKITMGDFLGNTGDVLPRTDGASDIGSGTARYDVINGRTANFIDPGAGTNITPTLGAVYNIMGLADNSNGGTLTVDVGGADGGTWIGALRAGGAGSTATVDNNLASVVMGSVVLGSSVVHGVHKFEIVEDGCLAGGVIDSGGFASLAGQSVTISAGSATAGGSFAWGQIKPGFGGTQTIRANNAGAWAMGQIAALATTTSIDASGIGSFAQGGVAGSGGIHATANGSFAFGLASSSGGITANAFGAFAGGYASSTGAILSSGFGSFAWGAPDVTGISATGSSSIQFGPGANAENDSLQVGIAGTGIAIKGTTGAFGTPANGQIYNNAGTVEIESGGTQIKLVQSTAYTLTATQAPSRTLNNPGAASIANNNAVLSALITDLKATGLIL
jgi:hypothetical protein